MRAKTKGKHEIRKRFAIVIGVAAVGVMALGAQAGAQTPAPTPPDPAVVKYDTTLTLTHEGCCTERTTLWHGSVRSDRDRNPGYDPANAVRECMDGRRVILFQQQPGADRKLDTDRNHFHPGWEVYPQGGYGMGGWSVGLAPWRGGVYAKVTPKVGDGFVCRADRSKTINNGNLCFEGPSWCPTEYRSPGVMALGAQTPAPTPPAQAVVKYDTELTIWKEHGSFLGTVWSQRVPNSVPDRANLVRKCMNRRRVILFKQRPGADRKLGADRSSGGDPTIPSTRSGDWQVSVPKGTLRHGDHVYAKATRKVGNGFVCLADRSETISGPGFASN